MLLVVSLGNYVWPVRFGRFCFFWCFFDRHGSMEFVACGWQEKNGKSCDNSVVS